MTDSIELALNPEMKKRLEVAFSSDHYQLLALAPLSVFDTLYTFIIRYCRLPRDYEAAKGGNPTTQGAVIDYMSVHPELAGPLTFAFVALAGVSCYLEYLEQKRQRSKIQQTYEKVYESLPKSDEITRSEQLTKLEKQVQSLNKHIQKIIDADLLLKKKYQKITLDPGFESISIEFIGSEQNSTQLVEQDENAPPLTGWKKAVNNYLKPTAIALRDKVLHPLWTALGLSSFAYWILWIGASLFTGRLETGIPPLGPFAFIVPLALGLAYPIIKIYHWIKARQQQKHTKHSSTQPYQPLNKKDDPKVLQEAAHEVLPVIRRALASLHYNDVKSELENSLQDADINLDDIKHSVENELSNAKGAITGHLDRKIQKLGKHAWRKTAIVGIASVVSFYTALQYGSWIIADFLQVVAHVAMGIPIINLALGVSFFVAAGLFGIYKAYQRYQEVNSYKKQLKEAEVTKIKIFNHEIENVAAKYKTIQDEIEALKAEVKLLESKLNEEDKHLALKLTDAVDQFQRKAFWVSKDPGPTSRPKYHKAKKYLGPVWNFLDGFMTGVFNVRSFILGAAIVLPILFMPPTAIPTIALLLTIGISYGIFKAYQNYHIKKERKAQELLAERAEKIETLVNQMEIAMVTKEALQKNKTKLEQHLHKTVSELTQETAFIPNLKSNVSILAQRKSHQPSHKDGDESEPLNMRKPKGNPPAPLSDLCRIL